MGYAYPVYVIPAGQQSMQGQQMMAMPNQAPRNLMTSGNTGTGTPKNPPKGGNVPVLMLILLLLVL